MKKAIKKIPKFKTESAEATFWLSHDSTDYVDWDKAEIHKRTAIREKESFTRAVRTAENNYFLSSDLFLKSSVVPIFDSKFEDHSTGERVDRLGIAGSASFLKVEERSFFVTAGHVIDQSPGVMLGTRSINALSSNEEVVALPPVWFTTPSPTLNSDPDVAVCEVQNTFLQNFTRLRFGEVPFHMSYDIAGFMSKDASPKGNFRLGYILSRIGLVLAPAKHQKYFGVEEIRSHNLVLSYSRISRALPELPIGISGGPIVAADPRRIASGKPLEFTYQGLVTRRGKANVKLFVCTSSDFVQAFIRQIYFDGPVISGVRQIELQQPIM